MHHCRALVISCIDFRFVSATQKYLGDLELRDDYDLISVPGSTKEIVSPSDEKNREFLLKNIGISYNLHQARQLLIIYHSDCGAYGGRKAFASDWEERETHVGDMQKSAEIIQAAFAEFKIKKVYARILEEGVVFEEEE